MFSLNSAGTKITIIKRAETCHLLCKRSRCCHSDSQTHMRDRISKLSPNSCFSDLSDSLNSLKSLNSMNLQVHLGKTPSRMILLTKFWKSKNSESPNENYCLVFLYMYLQFYIYAYNQAQKNDFTNRLHVISIYGCVLSGYTMIKLIRQPIFCICQNHNRVQILIF